MQKNKTQKRRLLIHLSKSPCIMKTHHYSLFNPLNQRKLWYNRRTIEKVVRGSSALLFLVPGHGILPDGKEVMSVNLFELIVIILGISNLVIDIIKLSQDEGKK